MKEKKQWFREIDNKGFSLIEILVAFMILLMVFQVLVLGVNFATKMGDRTEILEAACNDIGVHLYDKSSCVFGTARVELGNGMEPLVKTGWLYTGEEAEIEVPMNIIWVEEPVWEEDTGE